MCARENLLNKLVQKIGRPQGLYFPGESSKPVVPEPTHVQNNRKGTLEKTVFSGNGGVIVALFSSAVY